MYQVSSLRVIAAEFNSGSKEREMVKRLQLSGGQVLDGQLEIDIAGDLPFESAEKVGYFIELTGRHEERFIQSMLWSYESHRGERLHRTSGYDFNDISPYRLVGTASTVILPYSSN
ncbi:predicted protein [Histoplasma capsulatum H143]|uniref:Uncharacterized protein n=1 Tax=Ajellomyces capsulatus (strain H143) TaxID=544712 RepID=C6HPG8_AJECH|nr:predicted protein [Histoplasma capsulatum H143]